MFKKLTYFVCLLGVTVSMSVAPAATLAPDDTSIKDNLCLWLRRPELNYDPGTMVWTDRSGRGNDAQATVEGFVGPTLSSGENPAVFSHPFSAVHFNPEVQDILKATNLNEGAGLTDLTIFSVQKVVDIGRTDQRAVGFGSYNDGGRADHFNMSFDVTVRKDNGRIEGKNQDHPLGEFILYVARMDPEKINMWLNTTGTLSLAYTAEGSSYTTSNDQFYVGDLRYPAEGDFDVAEVVVFNTSLTDAQIEGVSEWLQTHVGISAGKGYPFAFSPDPRDGALLKVTWANLSWRAGDFAVSHDVYIGEDFDAVNTGAEGTFVGNQASTTLIVGFPGFPIPDGLEPGTTYYWRVDEVNEADPNSPWKGPIWSFSIAPKTAYNPSPADGTELLDPNTVRLTWTEGYGAVLHTVYLGNDYDEVDNATGGSPLGSTTYSPGPLEREKVYYWRVDEFDAVETHKGDVWNFTTLGAVGNPQPAYGATGVQLNAILSWTPADSAASHQLYFSTDKDAVRNADASSPEYKGPRTLGAESYDPGLFDAYTTYYWRVDEVDGQGNSAKGPLWIFTTGNFLLIDDFEGYTDDDPNNEAIWQTWIDGFGVPDNGAQVGYLLPPYAEQTIVHGGSQSMPLLYTNEAGITNSEASLGLTALRDWTQGSVAELSLWFRGGSSNAAEPLYVAISNSAGAPAVAAHDDSEAALASGWKQWLIPLQAFVDQGINMSNVDKIAIGLGSISGMAVAGGSGTMFIDDIALYQSVPSQ